MTETEVRFEDHEIYRPDVAGWHRDRMPAIPDVFPLDLRPDWICEILSPSNERNDIVRKMLTYQRSGVSHYWLLDPIAAALVVYRFTEPGYLLVQSAQGEQRIRAEPFERVTLSARGLVEGNDPDDEE